MIWSNCKSLSQAKKWLQKKSSILENPVRSRRESELNNMITVAKLITDSALIRQGSVGAHYRSDFKDRGTDWPKHTICHMGKVSPLRESYQQEHNCAKC